MLNMKTQLAILLYEKSGTELLDNIHELINESYSHGYETGFNHAMRALYPDRSPDDCVED